MKSSAASTTTLSSKKSKNLTSTLNTDTSKNISSKENFIVYPNPVKSGTELNIRSKEALPFDVVIVNLDGQVVYSQLNNHDNLVTVRVPNLNKGIYFLKTTNTISTRIQKILIE
ncbi:T9SS type A sorting domain-containing protein [Flavobacterium sp. XS2P12]|uniref:T9SS type A sorting domain-containing protein n=1 Tax=Flavobacterium melibiosi TaxID=3398734 RepID=UPI003A854430